MFGGWTGRILWSKRGGGNRLLWSFPGYDFNYRSYLCCIKIQLVLETALVLGAVTAAIFAFYLGYDWDDIERES